MMTMVLFAVAQAWLQRFASPGSEVVVLIVIAPNGDPSTRAPLRRWSGAVWLAVRR